MGISAEADLTIYFGNQRLLFGVAAFFIHKIKRR
nr:MAG TPA: hypothetical protein [Caudoviricetes sp.]